MGKHTEGEWEWSGLQLLANHPENFSSDPILIAQGNPFAPSDADKAVIAAAPKLLGAAIAIDGALAKIASFPGRGEFIIAEPLEQLRAAIAKATHPSHGSTLEE